MVKKQKYQEGSWFTVPLDSDGFAIGLVARVSPSYGIILAYFFNKRYFFGSNLSEVETLKPIDAIKVIQVGDLGIINGEWKVIGKLPDWNRSLWKVPNFVRREEFSGRIWLVKYADDNPNLVLSEELVTNDEGENLETDTLWGYKAAQKILSKLLK